MKWLKLVFGALVVMALPIYSLMNQGSEGGLDWLTFGAAAPEAADAAFGVPLTDGSDDASSSLSGDGIFPIIASSEGTDEARLWLHRVAQHPGGIPDRFSGSRFVGVGRRLSRDQFSSSFSDGRNRFRFELQETRLALSEIDTEVSMVDAGVGPSRPFSVGENPFSQALEEAKTGSTGGQGEGTETAPVDPPPGGDDTADVTPIADQPTQETPGSTDEGTPADDASANEDAPAEDPSPPEEPPDDPNTNPPPPPLSFLMLTPPSHPSGGYVQRAYRDRSNSSLFVGEDGSTLVINALQLIDAIGIQSDSMVVTRDFDGDSKGDLVRVQNTVGGSLLETYRGLDSSRLAFDQPVSILPIPGRSVLNMASFDLDGDSVPEIILQLADFPRLLVVRLDGESLRVSEDVLEMVLPFRVGLIFNWIEVRSGRVERFFFLFDEGLQRAFVISSDEPDLLVEASAIPLGRSVDINWNPELPGYPSTSVFAFESPHQLILIESTPAGFQLSASFEILSHAPTGIVGDFLGTDRRMTILLP